MHTINYSAHMHDTIAKYLKQLIVTKEDIGIGGGNKVMEVASIAHKVLGGPGVEVPGGMLIVLGWATHSTGNHKHVLLLMVIIIIIIILVRHGGSVDAGLVMCMTGHKVVALAHTVCAELVFVEVVTSRLVGHTTVTVVVLLVMAVTLTVATTVTATVAMAMGVPGWAATATVLAVSGTALVMPSMGLVIAVRLLGTQLVRLVLRRPVVSPLTSSGQRLQPWCHSLGSLANGALNIDDHLLNVVNGVVLLHMEHSGQGKVC